MGSKVILSGPRKLKYPLHNLIANKDICNDKHHKSGCSLSKWIINIRSHIMILNVNFGRNQLPLVNECVSFQVICA